MQFVTFIYSSVHLIDSSSVICTAMGQYLSNAHDTVRHNAHSAFYRQRLFIENELSRVDATRIYSNCSSRDLMLIIFVPRCEHSVNLVI